MRHYRGFTLMEVLFTLFIFSLILLGAAAAQSGLLRRARSQYYYQQAWLQAENMGNYVEAHHGNVSGYIMQWRQHISDVLPGGDGTVRDGNHGVQVTVKWGETKPSSCLHNEIGISGCVKLTI